MHNYIKIGVTLFRAILFLLLLSLFPANFYAQQTINIGVISVKPLDENQKIWLPLGKALKQKAPQYDFNITSYKQPQMLEQIAKENLDFAIVHPRAYVEIEMKYNATNVASIVQKDPLSGSKITKYGGVIATLSDRSDINELKDIKSKTVATIRKEGFATYLAPLDTLAHAGVELEKDCKMLFTEKSLKEVIQALRDKKADVGFFRSGYIEQMIQDGLVKENEFKVINAHKVKGYPYVISTPLYPEWAVAATTKADRNMVKTVVTALYQVEVDGVADYSEFDVPQSYGSTKELMIKYHIYPFEQNFNLKDIFKRYTAEVFVLVLLVCLLAIFAAFYFYKAMKKADKQAKQIESILSTAADGIHVLDKNGNLVMFSDTFASMLGYSRDEMKNITVFEWDRHSGPSEIQSIIQNTNGELMLFEALHTRKDGSEVNVEVNAKGVEINGNEFLFASSRDITYRKQAEKELRELNENLETKVQEELAKNRQKDNLLIKQARLAAIGELISNIAHQWRQPLNVIAIGIQDLKMAFKYGELDEAYLNKTVDDSMAQVKSLSKTIDELRHYFKSNSEQKNFKLREAVSDTMRLTEASLKSDQIATILEIDENITVFGSESDLSQALLNIINNSKEALALSTKEDLSIKITATEKQDFIELQIHNNGPKIDDDILDKIFDPYFTTKHKAQGAGLGLYMTKTIVEQNMGGTVDIKNDNDGVVCTIKLMRGQSC